MEDVYRSPHLQSAIDRVLKDNIPIDEVAKDYFFTQEFLEMKVREAKFQ